nr:MAG TPA: hypothetical protein [Caudoviricetes sp.]
MVYNFLLFMNFSQNSIFAIPLFIRDSRGSFSQ